MKNVCIVGYGAIGPVHAAAFEYVEGAKLYAVCDNNPEKIARCVEKYDVKTYSDFDEMLLDEKIDAVHICTPHYLHYEMTMKAMRAGKTVLTEKPVTMKREEFEKLLKMPGAEKIAVVFQNRLNPCVKKLKCMIDEGSFGKLICVKGILTWIRDAAYYQQDAWRGKWETEGGGVLINQAVHTLDLMSWLGGEIESCRAQKNNFSLENVIEVEDTFSAYFKYKSGASGVFFATNAYGVNDSPELQMVFENAQARYIDGKLFINGELIEEDSKATGAKSYWGKGHAALIKLLYDENKYFGLKDVKNTVDTMFDMYDA